MINSFIITHYFPTIASEDPVQIYNAYRLMIILKIETRKLP